MAYRRFRHIGVDKVKMDFAFFAIAFNIKKMVAKMTNGGLFAYLKAYLTNITPYKLFIRLFFVEKQKLVVHPHKNVQRVFFIYIGSFDTPSSFLAKKQAPIHVSAVFQVSPGCRSSGKPSWMFQTSPLSRSVHIGPFFSPRRACRRSNPPHSSLLRHQQPCGLVASSAMAVLQMLVVFFFDLGPG